MSWTTEITIKNTSNSRLKCKVKKGQVFENKKIGTGLQNVAAAKDYVFDLFPNSTQTVQIEVLCINQSLSPPYGPLNITNFAVNKGFHSQQHLWSIMNNQQN
jgi:hypothetical protein